MERTSKSPSKLYRNHGVGRRKSAVARVWIKPGKGAIEINDKKHVEYFGTKELHDIVLLPLRVVGAERNFDAKVNVVGGGSIGQAGAIKLGIARALLEVNEAYKAELKKHGLLTVDSRLKERKKYGQKGARRKFQFVKR